MFMNENQNKKILDMFLSPDMSNLETLENQIHLIWQSNKEILNESPVRVGHTDKSTYLERVNNSVIPENSKSFEELLSELCFYYNGMVKWNSPGVMINITPPPLLSTVAAAACCSVFNPNLAMDVPSGNIAFAELEVIKMLCDLVGWNYQDATGLMTFGGKGTVLYAIRTGLNSCLPEVRFKGLTRGTVKVFSTEQGHPCHFENCEWLGIGSDNCVRIPVLEDGTINIMILEQELRNAINKDVKIACIIVNGGSTLHTTIDEISLIVKLRDDLVEEYNLAYIPHIHVDSVIGWAWLMFDTYDFHKNKYGFSCGALKELKFVYDRIKDIRLADSFGVDFHKTGYAPYLCSTFVCRNKKKVYNLGESKQAPITDLEFGLYAPFTYTLESSRTGVSALEAWISLKQLGKSGYQSIIGSLVETGYDMRQYFNNTTYSICTNNNAHGFVALVMLFPKELRSVKKTNLYDFTDEELLLIAKYNHKFYLYILSLNKNNEVPFLLDYVSKQATIRNVKIGVMKLFPMSPFCNLDYLKSFYTLFETTLNSFDECWKTIVLNDSPYRPKPFVTR